MNVPRSSSNHVDETDSQLGAAAGPRWILLAVLGLVGGFAIYVGARGELISPSVEAATQNQAPNRDFDLSRLTVPKREIFSGGPPKDGIPAISKPEYQTVQEATWMSPDDRVIGVHLDGQARAYPLRILNYHEIINDTLGENAIAVTYCPLCDSSVVFDRKTSLGLREFGVSGLLYNSNVLMYDRSEQTESLWSQLASTGISGPGTEQNLRTFPLVVTTWGNWIAHYPDSTVVSRRTGFTRDYAKSPYERYFKSPQLMFPVNQRDERLPSKTPILGVWTKDGAKAYPLKSFTKEVSRLDDKLGELSLTLEFDQASQTLRISKADPGIEWMYSYWFAWAAFRPKTELFETAPVPK